MSRICEVAAAITVALSGLAAFWGGIWAVAAAMDGVLAIIPTLSAFAGLAGYAACMETLEKENQDEGV